ncbi:MAG: YebC/PmpR family DNA-binding transcriptional regulator [Myxococcota bacterium]
MSGHSKWSTIKHKKSRTDAKRSKVWGKLIREVTVAARMGGADPGANPRLRKAMQDARAANMPKDRIDRAVHGATAKDAARYEELTYEGYGPAGVAVLVECLTDNRNRTLSDVRVAFDKNGGRLGSGGSVRFVFRQEGQLIFAPAEDRAMPSEEQLLQVGLELEIDDVKQEGESLIVTCAPARFHAVLSAYEQADLVPGESQLAMVARNDVTVRGKELRQLFTLLEQLEDLDDVQKVWSNAAWNDEL